MKVFVSATSADLKACRDAVKDVLLQGDIQPVTQEVLHADHRNLPEFLDALMQSSDAVVCLVGKVFGAASEGEPYRSYTQREYDCAKKLGKPVFVFLATDAFYWGRESQQSQQQAEWQRQHYQTLMREKYCRTFDTQSELEKEVGVSLWLIRRAAGRIPMRYYHLPPAPPFFVGRIDEKAQLLKAMAGRSPGTIAIIGMAGQGKSTLVHHVLNARLEGVTLPFQAGFWWTAGLGGFTFDVFLDEALTCLTEGGFDKNEAPRTQQRVQRLLGEMQKRPVLIVIDAIERWLRGWVTADADQHDTTGQDRCAAFEGLDDFLAQTTGLANGSHLIATSRAMPDVLEDLDKTVIPVRRPTDYDVGLQGLEPTDAVAMLKSYDVEASDEQLRRIAAHLAFHPLALRVFGGYVKKKYGGVLEKIANLQAWDRKKTLAKLFDEVYDRLPGGPASRRFLEVASCAIEETPLEVLRAAIEHVDEQAAGWNARDTALMLADWQVISFDARSGVVGMHALLKEHFAKRLTEADRVALHGRFAEWYSKQPIAKDPTTLADAKARLLAFKHALIANDLERCERIVWGQVTPLYSLIEWLRAFGHFVYGSELLAGFAAAAHDRLRARVLIARAPLLRPIGGHNEGRNDLNQAIATLDREADAQVPADVFDLAGALSNRGTIHLELAQYAQAVADFDRAVELLQTLPDDDRRAFQLAAVHANRAMVLREMGLLRKAIEDCTASIELHGTRLDAVYRQVDAELALAHSNRGNAYRDLRRYDEALQDYNAAIKIYSNLVNVGQTQFREPQALGRIIHASVLANMNRHGEAISELDHAVATCRDLIRAGRTHVEPMLAFAQMRRAWSLGATRKAKESVEESQAAREIYARLAQAGRRDLQGPYTHSLLIEAVVRHRAGDYAGARLSWHLAMELATRLIEAGESDLRLIVVRYSFEWALEMVDSDPAHAAQLVTTALNMVEPALRSEEPTEGLEAETRHAISFLRAGVSEDTLPLDWARIAELESWLNAKGEGAG